MKRKGGYARGDEAGAKSILDAYFNDSVPEEVKDEIFDWFLAFGHRENVDRALFELYLERMEVDSVADKRTDENYRDICHRLGFPVPVHSPAGDLTKKRRPQWLSMPLKIAAVLVPFIVLAAVLLSRSTDVTGDLQQETFLALETGADRQQRVELPDGHQIWVNEGSNIDCKGGPDTGWEVSWRGKLFSLLYRAGSILSGW